MGSLAFVLQLWQSLYDCLKKGGKNGYGHMVTHFIIFMTDNCNGGHYGRKLRMPV